MDVQPSGIKVKGTKINEITALIVDYSEHIRALLTMHLTTIGLKEVHQAGDGLSAIEKYRQTRPSVVFIDYILPKLNGLNTIKQLKQINPNVKVVMLTAVSSIEIVKTARELGVNYYVLKPWQTAKLAEAIKFIFNIHESAS